MNDLRKASEEALGFLDWYIMCNPPFKNGKSAFDKAETLRQALAQTEQEPVAWVYRGNFHPFDPSDWAEGESVTPLYTAPPKREWVGLEEESLSMVTDEFYAGAVWAEAKLKEKNT